MGLSKFVFEIPTTTTEIGPVSVANPRGTTTFRLNPNDACYDRLLHTIASHFDKKCDADEQLALAQERIRFLEREVARLTEREAHLESLCTSKS